MIFPKFWISENRIIRIFEFGFRYWFLKISDNRIIRYSKTILLKYIYICIYCI
ncbi:hypothetical protein HanIR_Chr01g0044061 [Helianthus annuus]|nr:hypothetical protein HanIR_Chr01g0044061 [Helianthus annuus]